MEMTAGCLDAQQAYVYPSSTLGGARFGAPKITKHVEYIYKQFSLRNMYLWQIAQNLAPARLLVLLTPIARCAA